MIGGSINITTSGGGGEERWVEPVYTDEWVFSDGEEHTIHVRDCWDADDPMNGMVYYEIDAADCYGVIHRRDHMDWTVEKALEELDKITVLDCGGNYTAYRKYTPGHWEDGNGNWINGSWDNFDNGHDGWSELTNTIDVYPQWIDEDSEEYLYVTKPDIGWFFSGIPQPLYDNKKAVNEPNMNLLYVAPDPAYVRIFTRTWNNTKPAPEA